MGWCLIAATGDANWFLGWLTNLYLFAQVAIGLGFVIFVHELGHFLAAKACGVKCEKFYVGFDIPVNLGVFKIPAALFKFQWGETEYGIGAIPLGGYVKMLGQDDNPQAAEEEAERTKIEGPDGEEEVDPRSYTAKSVPQRMLIISAGVIMNLIFAVILAACAYMLGVAYQPAQIGGTLPGSPAWAADLPIDAKIVQIGQDGYRSEHLRWGRDLMTKVMLNGADQDLMFLVDYPEEEEDRKVVLKPSAKNQEDREGRPAIGILPAQSTVVSARHPEAFGHFSAFQAEPPLQTDDKIVAMEGEPIESFHDIQRVWATRGSQPLKLTIERLPDDAPEGAEPERIESVMPPNPMRDLGLGMKIGPITERGIQINSPAAEADLRPGDIITQINGEPAGDATGLPARMIPLIGETIEITVERGGKPITKSIEVRKPRMVFNAFSRDAPVAVDALGLAFQATSVVEEVTEGSPADKAGLQAGDRLLKARFMPASDKLKKLESKSVPGAGEGRGPFRDLAYLDTMELGNQGFNWPFIHTRIQRSQPDTQVELTYERTHDQETAKIHTTDPMLPVASADEYFPNRGLMLREVARVHQAGFLDAWPLGLRESKERIMEVFVVLEKLFTGKIAPTNLAGAPMIVAGAVSEASQGYGRLLMFLVLLSCNLAVLNFLPIPVLDGGHMVFLIAEGLRGKPVDERLQMNLTFFGLMLLLGLMVFVFALDIGRLAGITGMMMLFGLL